MEPHPDEQFHPGDEELNWSEQHENLKGKKPKGSYNKFSEHARTLISTEKQCALFCGGKKCKYCTWENWTEDKTEIKGLYSNWVTDNILAMARPSSKAIKKFEIIKQFKEKGITSVISIQKPGEHADCGYGLEKSGFTYDPQMFMENGIYFYNFGWDDYGVASLSTILDMVKVIQFAVSDGKVAIHCHAGLGRTGVIIASYLVFTNRIPADDAIQFVRSKRHGAIQTRGQMEVIREFEQYLKPFRIIFSIAGTDSREFSLQQFLNRQKHILHGYEARKLKYVPKVIYVVCERLLELSKKGNSLSQIRKCPSVASFDKKLNQNGNIESENGIPRVSSHPSLESQTSTTSSHLKRVGRRKSVCMEDLPDEKLLALKPKPERELSIKSDTETDVFSTSDIVSQKSDDIDSVCEDLGSLSTIDVAEALGTTDVEEGIYTAADIYQQKLNDKDSAWKDLANEQNQYVLAEIMWSWLDQLKEPILNAQDLSVIMKTREVDAVLQKLERGTRHTIEYIMKIIYKLKPLEDDMLTKIYEKLLSYLTHQWVVIDSFKDMSTSWSMSTRDSIMDTETKEHWTEMKKNQALALYTFFIQLQETIDKKFSAMSNDKTENQK
ncbi:protein tyrosine phosphatase domain-containing protein 1 [Mytilus galloprovincialis]|uniref:Protein tyrosine phosphatase domain-containing protein 1 n=2 Tax=Mytilus galloprovincialis TaxID=29158 RepID=A0A8B6CZX7_MYTGA|nr:protein tyrosine phosphatase domain-containing protein 1 [Mytilus galloprovincialis]